MGLRLKFNLLLVAAFALGLVLVTGLSWQVMRRNARDEVIHDAQMIAGQAAAIRGYTVSEIQPLMASQSKSRFLPQSIPAYAAATTEREFMRAFPDYVYKEAALNPTNPSNLASPDEVEIINRFRESNPPPAITTTRETPNGTVMLIARPLKVGNKDCLICHSTPDVAPVGMVDVYGPNHGFGWQVGEVIGAQIVSVPTQVALNRLNHAYYTYVAGMTLIFFAIMVMLNLLLDYMVINPMNALKDELKKARSTAG